MPKNPAIALIAAVLAIILVANAQQARSQTQLPPHANAGASEPLAGHTGTVEYPSEAAAARKAALAFFETGAIARDRRNAQRPPALSCAVAVNGKLAWAEAFGIADLEQHPRATALTKFRIESVSKTLTGQPSDYCTNAAN
jgi:CubicO group peptidase (beta-lactamase class C family)